MVNFCHMILHGPIRFLDFAFAVGLLETPWALRLVHSEGINAVIEESCYEIRWKRGRALKMSRIHWIGGGKSSVATLSTQAQRCAQNSTSLSCDSAILLLRATCTYLSWIKFEQRTLRQPGLLVEHLPRYKKAGLGQGSTKKISSFRGKKRMFGDNLYHVSQKSYEHRCENAE